VYSKQNRVEKSAALGQRKLSLRMVLHLANTTNLIQQLHMCDPTEICLLDSGNFWSVKNSKSVYKLSMCKELLFGYLLVVKNLVL